MKVSIKGFAISASNLYTTRGLLDGLDCWTGSEETSPQPVSLQGNAPEMLRNDDLESCLLKFVEPARSQFLEGIKASRHQGILPASQCVRN